MINATVGTTVTSYVMIAVTSYVMIEAALHILEELEGLLSSQQFLTLRADFSNVP